jgi:hypothetical protein
VSANIIHTMDDDAFPNFGNAYTGASPSNPNSASWNPALRPNTESLQPEATESTPGDDDDFFDRYQEPTPRKKRIESPNRDDVDEEATLGSPAQNRPISVEEAVHVTSSKAEPEELGMQPETTADVEAPISHHDHPVDEESVSATHDEDAAVFDPDETAEEQALGLEEHMPDVANEAPPALAEPALKGVEQTDQAAVQEEIHRPEENYDYQGEVTEMEKAIDESEEAPLMADEEPTPQSGPISRAPTFEPQPNDLEDSLQGQVDQTLPETTASHPAMIQRSFTTNFTEIPQKDRQESTTEHAQVLDEDWPAAGDDETFGDLLDAQQIPEQELSQVEALPTGVALESLETTGRDWPDTEEDHAFGEILSENAAPDESHELPNGGLEDTQQAGDAKAGDWAPTAVDTSFGTLLGEQSQQTMEETPSFSQNTSSEIGSDAVDEHWPDAEADDTFGELLGNQAEEFRPTEGLAIEKVNLAPSSDARPVEEDLAAAFAAALDDDDILDDDTELDPALLFGDDDDGLLEDDDFLGGSQEESQMLSQPSSMAGTSYTPNTMQHSFQQPTISTPGTPFIEQNMSRSGGTPSTGLFDIHNQSAPAQGLQRPPITTAQSFVDKAKGGYQSPYDLPMEVVKPRRRPQQTPRESSNQFPAPPPRSSSFHQPAAPPSFNDAPPMPSTLNTPGAPPVAATATPPLSSQSTPKTIRNLHSSASKCSHSSLAAPSTISPSESAAYASYCCAATAEASWSTGATID